MHFFTHLLNFLMPPRCLLCTTRIGDSNGVCADCWQKLHFITPPLCPVTGVPFYHAWPPNMVSQRLANGMPDFDKARAALFYHGLAARQLLARFKYGDRPEIADNAAQWMQRIGGELLEESDMLIPVPLHPARLLGRRFNQAAELARALSQLTGIPMETRLLRRQKRTPSQTGLNRSQRRRNVAGAFSITADSQEKLRGKTVILVDDVMTSGATVNACARLLRRHKAKNVYVLCMAAVILPQEREAILSKNL